MGVFEVADYESIIRFPKFNMADPIWRTKIRKISELDENRYTRVFTVADYKFIMVAFSEYPIETRLSFAE